MVNMKQECKTDGKIQYHALSMLSIDISHCNDFVHDRNWPAFSHFRTEN